jgi:hypothetical protein
MHVGRNNPKQKYYINGQELSTVEEEKDIGVLVHNSLKPAKHCEKAANMAGAVLRQIQRNFHYRDRKVFVKQYKQYVLPHLEFASPAWAPWTVADIEKLENVKKRRYGWWPDWQVIPTRIDVEKLTSKRWQRGEK